MNGLIGLTPKNSDDFQRARRLRHRVGGILLAAALLAIATSGSVGAAPAAPEKRTPVISFESTAIVVSGVTPRAEVILFGVERKSWGYAMRTTDVFLTIESDQRGEARFELKRSIASGSIYSAIDGVSGDFAVASPGGKPVNVRPAQALRMKGKTGQEFDAFDIEGHWIEAVCVRRGQGAWRLSLMDESSVDESPTRGTVQMGAARMKAIGAASASPGKFRRHDVLIVIDPYNMTVVATAVNE